MNEDYVNGEMLENFSNYNKSSDYPFVWSSDVWEEKNVPLLADIVVIIPLMVEAVFVGVCWEYQRLGNISSSSVIG